LFSVGYGTKFGMNRERLSESNQNMCTLRTLKVLLAGEQVLHNLRPVASLLEDLGCRCRTVYGFDEVSITLRTEELDLVVAPTSIGGRGVNSLISLLRNARTTMLCFHAVEHGYWWIPVLRGGRNCFGEPAMRSKSFARELKSLVQVLKRSAERKALEISWDTLLGSHINAAGSCTTMRKLTNRQQSHANQTFGLTTRTPEFDFPFH